MRSTSALLNGLFLLQAAVTAATFLFGPDSEGKGKPEISTGVRINLPDKGFSIAPPEGWEIHRNQPATSLLLQIPYTEGLEYQRTIQVLRYKGAHYIDEITGREFEKVLRERFSESPAISGYTIRDHILTPIVDNSEAILYYCEFKLNQLPMMQAHILVSSADDHYLVTYTDIRENFEKNSLNGHLDIAWRSMTSIKLTSTPPTRFSGLFLSIILFAFLLALGGAIAFLRNHNAGDRYGEHYSEADDDEEIDTEDKPVTQKASANFDASFSLTKHKDSLRPDDDDE